MKSPNPVVLIIFAVIALSGFAQGVYAGGAPTVNGAAVSNAEPSVIHTLPPAIKDELRPPEVTIFGQAPGASWQVVRKSKPRSYLIVLGKNDDIIAGLYKFAEANDIKGAYFSGVGAVGCAALGFFDQEQSAYEVIKLPLQAEVASLSGNISLKADKQLVHAHGVFSLKSGRCLGGQVLYAPAWPTVEIILTETDVAMEKDPDAETGLSLFNTAAGAK